MLHLGCSEQKLLLKMQMNGVISEISSKIRTFWTVNSRTIDLDSISSRSHCSFILFNFSSNGFNEINILKNVFVLPGEPRLGIYGTMNLQEKVLTQAELKLLGPVPWHLWGGTRICPISTLQMLVHSEDRKWMNGTTWNGCNVAISARNPCATVTNVCFS